MVEGAPAAHRRSAPGRWGRARQSALQGWVAGRSGRGECWRGRARGKGREARQLARDSRRIPNPYPNPDPDRGPNPDAPMSSAITASGMGRVPPPTGLDTSCAGRAPQHHMDVRGGPEPLHSVLGRAPPPTGLDNPCAGKQVTVGTGEGAAQPLFCLWPFCLFAFFPPLLSG